MTIKAQHFQKKHIKTKVNWMNNPRINSSMFFDLPATVERTREWFEQNRNNGSRVDLVFLEGDKIIAMTGLTSIHPKARHAEFYIMVHPQMQGKGIGKKTSIWTYNYAFNIEGLNKIYLYTNNDNTAAYRLYEYAGFQLEGILRQQKYRNGKLLDRRFYGLLKEDWENLPWKTETVYEF